MNWFEFLNKKEWAIVVSERSNPQKIKTMEEDYWWIDSNETAPALVEYKEFFFQCLGAYKQVAQKEGLLSGEEKPYLEFEEVGHKVVFEYLYDRYLVRRHESDPDIYYNYVTQLSLEAGCVIADKWNENPSELEEFVDIIIRETSMDFIKDIYVNKFDLDDEMEWHKFESKLSALNYDLLKWYHNHEEFELYKQNLLLAVFQVGVMMVLDKK